MHNLIEVFINRFGDWQTAIWQHLQISLAALLLAILIAVPLSIFLVNYRRLAAWVLQLTGIVQTIPSLAILGLLIPFIGIGTLPAIVTLVVYGLFPIVQNTITAFWELDPQLEEAATAFGMTRWEKLRKYQLALAMPVMMSGIRTAAVMIIGTATLAALIGAGGLGSLILLGIDRNDSALILIGAISSAFLAVVISLILGALTKRRPKTLLLSFLTTAVLVVASFGQPYFLPMGNNKLIIAGKLGAEPDILIHLYKELIEQDSHLQVEVKPNFGKTSFLYEALKAGSIDIYPEFSGTITASLLTNPPQLANDQEAVYEAARDGIYQQDKLIYLKPMAYQNTYAIAVKEAYAMEHGLETISDLKKVESTARTGFSLEFNDRPDGKKGLESLYGLKLNIQTMEPALRYQALEQDKLDIIEVYSTDSQIIKYGLKLLQDDKHLFPPYQGAPLMREETLKQHPELEGILNKLHKKITATEMATMNYQVDVEGKSAKEVAHDFLSRQGLLK
ncbi:ABC transporter permease/substrate-binding protein [Abiotrophia defectiva]|uniref:ABC transporter permease/substrate-binding protein n=1 Tax=Abiotrophia defectiva TaxID=46125 RepID=UPI003C71281C